MNKLILPGDPLFDVTLATAPPPNWRAIANQDSNFAFVARADTGILEAVNYQDVTEYLMGGEYDQRLANIGDDEKDCWEDNLLIPDFDGMDIILDDDY